MTANFQKVFLVVGIALGLSGALCFLAKLSYDEGERQSYKEAISACLIADLVRQLNEQFSYGGSYPNEKDWIHVLRRGERLALCGVDTNQLVERNNRLFDLSGNEIKYRRLDSSHAMVYAAGDASSGSESLTSDGKTFFLDVGKARIGLTNVAPH